VPDRPLGGVVWCGRGTGCGCAALLLSSTHPLGCWKDGGGVVWLVWFGMLLGFEATSLLAWLVIGCWPLMRFVRVGGWWWLLVGVARGSWCFGVCPVFAVGALAWWWFVVFILWGGGCGLLLRGVFAGVRGCCLGTV